MGRQGESEIGTYTRAPGLGEETGRHRAPGMGRREEHRTSAGGRMGDPGMGGRGNGWKGGAQRAFGMGEKHWGNAGIGGTKNPLLWENGEP